MKTYREMLTENVDRSNSFIKKIDKKRTVVHMLDVQNLCLDSAGADYIQSVGGAPLEQIRSVPQGESWSGREERASRSYGLFAAYSRTGLMQASVSIKRPACARVQQIPWLSWDLEWAFSEGVRAAPRRTYVPETSL